jgi:hypothetical protein
VTTKRKDSKSYLALVRSSVAERRYEQALGYAVAGLKRCGVEKQENRKRTFLRLIRVIVTGLESSLGGLTANAVRNPSCSFCGRSQPEVRILAGATGAICKDCADRARSYFSTSA